jgi:putative iron-regulated protein
MVAQWAPGESGNYRAELLAEPPQQVFQTMLFGMGSLSLGELAGERMKVSLEANSYEDEHDRFSDDTHNSHFYNAKGVQEDAPVITVRGKPCAFRPRMNSEGRVAAQVWS